MASPIAHPHESKIYSEFSRYYDKIFENVFGPRIQRVIGELNIAPGSSVLEVGVGTGLALSAYPTNCHVTGIDLAPDMLERARRKVARKDGPTSILRSVTHRTSISPTTASTT